MPPLVVASRRSRPPAPTVPDRSFDPKLPITVTGKSVWIPPFVVAARTLNSADAGNEACTLPLVVVSSISPLHLALPMATVAPPNPAVGGHRLQNHAAWRFHIEVQLSGIVVPAPAVVIGIRSAVMAAPR